MMKTRLGDEYARIGRAVSLVRRRACPGLSRLLDHVKIMSYTHCRATQRKCGLVGNDVEDLYTNTTRGLYLHDSKTILLHVKNHGRRINVLAETLVHELTHHALADGPFPDEQEEGFCMLAEQEFRQGRRLHLTRQSKLARRYIYF